MSDEREQGYIAGQRRVYLELLRIARSGLGFQGELGDEKAALAARVATLEAERQEIVAALREVCSEHGDNDWSDNLHITDVIEKHLFRHLGFQ